MGESLTLVGVLLSSEVLPNGCQPLIIRHFRFVRLAQPPEHYLILGLLILGAPHLRQSVSRDRDRPYTCGTD